MARIRSIHPGIWTDEDFVLLSPLARLCLIGIWQQAWDDGVFKWKPVTLKMAIFPNDDVNVEPLMAELVSRNWIQRIEVEGKSFGVCRNFRIWQRPKKPNASGVLPEEYRTYAGLDAVSHHNSPTSTESLPHQSSTSTVKSGQMEDGGWRMEEGRGRMEDGEEEEKYPSASQKNISPSKRRSDAKGEPADFAEFWAAWPHKVGKKAALKSWTKLTPDETLRKRIFDAIERWKRSRQWQDGYVPHAATWLNGERWDDEVPPDPEPTRNGYTNGKPFARPDARVPSTPGEYDHRIRHAD